MQTIYRCSVCGQEYTSKEQAAKHDCTHKYKVNRCHLWAGDKISFRAKISTRFSQRNPRPDETIHSSIRADKYCPALSYEVETTDISKENEKKLHKALLKAAIEDREKQFIDPLRKALKELEQEKED